AQQTAAPESARGAATSNVTPARWQSRLLSHLERRKRYPATERRQGTEGTAHLRFGIDAAGNVLNPRVVRSSGSAALDAAAVDMARRASPVPPPPPGAPRDITVPVRFS